MTHPLERLRHHVSGAIARGEKVAIVGMPSEDWRARYLAGLRTQYRAMFRTMAQGSRWNVHRGSAGLVLLQEGAHMDVPLPVLLHDVQAMTEETMVTRVHAALGA